MPRQDGRLPGGERFKKVITRLNQTDGLGFSQEPATRVDAPNSPAARANRAVAALDQVPMPQAWGQSSPRSSRAPQPPPTPQAPPLRVVPQSPPPNPATLAQHAYAQQQAYQQQAYAQQHAHAQQHAYAQPAPAAPPHMRYTAPAQAAHAADPASLRATAPGPAPMPHLPVPLDSVVAQMPQARPHEPVFAQGSAAMPVTAGLGKVIVMFGCRGGAGATTLAVNLGAHLARSGKSVCLVDLDLQLGDVFVALDLPAETSLAALAREAETIDGPALRRRLARHDTGLYALAQTGRIDDIDAELGDRMPSLIAALRQNFDYVIVDGVRDFGDYALSVLDVADQVALVLAQDVASVRRAARVITLIRRLGYGDGRIRIVVNRVSRDAEVSGEEIQRALQTPLAAAVRNDWKRVHAAMNEGALVTEVARTAGVTADIAGLAMVLAGPQAMPLAAAPVKKRGLFGFLRRGGR